MSGQEAYCALHKGYFPAKSCPYCFELRERKREARLDRIWEDLGNTLREMGEEEPGWRRFRLHRGRDAAETVKTVRTVVVGTE